MQGHDARRHRVPAERGSTLRADASHLRAKLWVDGSVVSARATSSAFRAATIPAWLSPMSSRTPLTGGATIGSPHAAASWAEVAERLVSGRKDEDIRGLVEPLRVDL